MSDIQQDVPPSETAPEMNQSVNTKRSPMVRAIVWGLISVFLIVFLLKWDVHYGYSNTSSARQERIELADRGNRNEIAFLAAKAKVKGVAANKKQSQKKVNQKKVNQKKVNQKKAGRDKAAPNKDPKGKAPQKAIPGKGLGEGQQNVVVLTTDKIDSKAIGLKGMLTREIVRQALLIGGREGLGLQTRDASLRGEVRLVENPESFPVQLITHINWKREVSIEVKRSLKTNAPVRWDSKKITLPKEFAFEALIEQTEELSRTGFVEALKSVGYTGNAPQWVEESTIPDKTLQQLNEWNFIAQYTVIQDMHAAIWEEGESPERLAVLTRAYANLGSLTECLWSPAHKVFKARALLYAERLTARTKDSPWALAHRVYARTFAGRHHSALVDIKAIQSVKEENAGKRPLPAWLDLLDAYCSYKPKVLEKAVEQEETKHLAVYLRALQTDPIENQFEMLSRIAQLLELETACCRAVDQLCDISSLGIKRRTTEGRQAQLWEPLYQKLLAGNLPDSIRKPIDDHMKAFVKLKAPLQFRIQVTDSLKNAKSTELEPSLNALGQLLQEVSFLHTLRMLDVLTTSLAINPNYMLPQVRPLIKGHPYEFYIESYASNSNDAKAAYEKLLTSYNPLELELISGKLITNSYFKLNRAAYNKLSNQAQANLDQVYQDQLQHKRYIVKYFKSNNNRLRGVAGSLKKISPHMPQTVALNIKLYKNYVDKKHTELIKKYGDQPVVLSALAKRYLTDHNDVKAEETLKLRIDVAPDYRSYKSLASIYDNRGDTDKWIETLKQALELPSLGLEDSLIHDKLAHHYIRLGEWEQAEPHAMQAARSYSGWGLKCGAWCFEGLGDLDRAEQLMKACSMRYEYSNADWYFWCVRTDHGDLEAARRLAEREVLEKPDPNDLNQTMKTGIIHLIQGSKSKAFDSFSLVFQKHKNSYGGLHAALLADELGLTDKRDELLKQVAEQWSKDYAKSELANYFQSMLLKQNSAKWNPDWFESLITQLSEGNPTNFYYFAGKFLEQRGQKTLAEKYLQLAATSRVIHKNNCVLATHYLRSQKKKIEPRRITELEADNDQIKSRTKQTSYLRQSGKQAEAIKIFDEILKSNPKMLTILNSRAQAYEAMKNYPAAIADYKKMIEIDPRYWLPHNNLAYLYAGCEKDEIRNGSLSLKHAQKAFDLLPTKYWTNYGAIAVAYAEQGKFDKAIEMQNKTMQHAPTAQKINAKLRLELFKKRKPYRSSASKK